jgi:hypothetical protein
LRANIGEEKQTLTLHGSGLDRILAISSEGGAFDLAAGGTPAARDTVFRLDAQAKQGDRFALRLKVQGIEEPLDIPGALEVIGRRPRIDAVRKSLPQENSVALRPDEVPAGVAVSFALSVVNLDATPTVEVGCSGEHDMRQKVALSPGDRNSGVKLDIAGEGMLFLSLDPGVIGQPGCRLTAVVATQSSGRSDPYGLGQVVRVPRIDQFSLTDEKLGEGVYAGILKGQDLDTIEKTGWDAEHGTPVQSIPAAAPGEAQRQSLKVAMPWPAPAPHAPVFVWLRGESQGRATGARY